MDRLAGAAAGIERSKWLVATLVAVLVGSGAACGGGSSSSSGTGGTDGGGSGGSTTDASGSGGKTGGDASSVDATVLSAAGLGKSCATAADCGTGLTCLLPTDSAIFGNGGPANGYCTVACTDTGVSAGCNQAGGTCVNMGPDMNTPQVYCLLNCTRGKPGAAGAAGKCRARQDVACSVGATPANGSAPKEFCVPTCSSDSQCPTGRVCDEAASVCVATQRPGTPVGTHCTPDPTGATNTCAGRCLAVGSGTVVSASFCSRRCVLGVLTGCNWVGAGMSLSSGGSHGVCALSAANSDSGDQGYCAQECDSVADCADKTDPGASCDTTVMAVQHGICSFGVAGDGGADSSAPADGGADAGADVTAADGAGG